MNLLLELDFQSDLPIYLQLKNQIIRGIATGELKPGEPLPSVRQMAADLGINLHTVNKTYNYLKQDGFIIIHRQKGVVISPESSIKITGDYLAQLNHDLVPIVTEAFCRGMKEEDFISLCRSIYETFEKK